MREPMRGTRADADVDVRRSVASLRLKTLPAIKCDICGQTERLERIDMWRCEVCTKFVCKDTCWVGDRCKECSEVGDA